MRLIQNNIVNLIVTIFILSHLSCLSLFESTQDSADLLPRETELYTWKLVTSTLYKHNESKLPNVPDYYKYYSVVELVTGSYESINNKSIHTSVTIVTTSDPEDAYGLFTRERILNEKPYIRTQSTSYWKSKAIGYKGNKFIKIETTDSDFLQTQKSFLEVILQKIPFDTVLPDSLNKVAQLCDPDSVVLFNEGIPQIPYIKKIITAIKYIESLKVSTFYKFYQTTTDASQNYDFITKKDRSYMIMESGTLKIAFKKYEDNYIFIALYKNIIFGIFELSNYTEGKKYIKIIQNELSAS